MEICLKFNESFLINIDIIVVHLRVVNSFLIEYIKLVNKLDISVWAILN